MGGGAGNFRSLQQEQTRAFGMSWGGQQTQEDSGELALRPLQRLYRAGLADSGVLAKAASSFGVRLALAGLVYRGENGIHRGGI